MNLNTKTILQVLLLSGLSCGHRFEEHTPKNFVNKTKATPAQYSQDSTYILNSMQKLLNNRQEFFSNSAYFEGTSLILDTILYSPDFKKVAIIILTMNPTFRQLIPDKKSNFYFDATSYVGVRQSDSILLSWMGPNFTNSPDQLQLSQTVRETYFNQFASSDTTNGQSTTYNLNDVRFSTCSVWKEMEERRIQKNEFEQFKLNHPDRVHGSK